MINLWKEKKEKMMMHKNARYTVIVLCVLMLGLALIFNQNHSIITSSWWKYLGISYENEAPEGSYYQIVDDQKKLLTMTSHLVHVGDEFWTWDNKHYRVTKVKDFMAHCDYLGKENIAWLDEWDEVPATTYISVQGKEKSDQVVGIYHTHSDESYRPTDGVASRRGNGGILKVGSVFAKKLESLGLKVYHDQTPHDPHDASAYQRSRRTAVNLLKKQPAILFDVHRDAVPAEVYANEINGQKVTKIKMVVGKQNQNKQANLEFAKTLKAAMDKTHPGLFEGIFLAKGNYNQDLGPRMMLVEVGSDSNSREDAERGISLFADTVPKVLGIYESRANNPKYNQVSAPDLSRSKSGAGQAIWWLLGILIIGGGLFLIISTGSIGGGVQKLKEFAGSEWQDIFKKRKE